jgi:hypothetical protein
MSGLGNINRLTLSLYDSYGKPLQMPNLDFHVKKNQIDVHESASNDDDDEEPRKTKRKKHILQLIVSEIEEKEPRNNLLKHLTIKRLVNEKWFLLPFVIYYWHLFLFFLFILFYSINIEVYASTAKNSGLNVTCKLICFLSLIYFIVLEIFQIGYNLAAETLKEYFSSFKNKVELIMFPLCVVALFCDLVSIDIHLKSSLYSISILFAYFIFTARLDKIPKIGVYIDVIAKILRKSLTILVFLLIALVAFILAFRNRSRFYEYENSETNGVNQMSYFNENFEFNLFQLTAFSLGGLSTENMGIEIIEGKTLVNYLIYGCFIFFMPIMFLNIFQSISIDEIQRLYEESEANEVRKKIEYIFLVEEIKKYKFLKRLRVYFEIIEEYLGRLYTYLCSITWLGEILQYDESKKSENAPGEKSKEKGFDKYLGDSLGAKMNQLNSKSDSSETKIEQNFEEMKSKIGKQEQSFEDLNSKIDKLIKDKQEQISTESKATASGSSVSPLKENRESIETSKIESRMKKIENKLDGIEKLLLELKGKDGIIKVNPLDPKSDFKDGRGDKNDKNTQQPFAEKFRPSAP